MKNLFKVLLVTVLFFSAGASASAQKIAYIDMDSLVSLMPEFKTARDSAQKYIKQLENELVIMQNEFQTKQEQYTKDQATMPPAMKANRERQLNELYQRIQEFQQTAQQDIQAKNDQLSKPIYEKANKAVAAVAKAKGYKMVIDASTTNILYKEPTDDIMKDVKTELKIK